MTKSSIIGIHGGHAEIGSRGAKGYLDEVKVNRKLVKYIKEVQKSLLANWNTVCWCI